jgi:flavin reductase (DIM6/NTAB) family NADH-FMN oxidoreductase RutF
MDVIPFDQLSVRSHHLWDSRWLLLASGDFVEGRYNAMTVAWGSLGTMWNRPFAQVVVRPIRFTYQFMEQYDTFTLSAFREGHRQALQLMGTMSGRDGDKIMEAGLTPIAASKVAAPTFAEAELVIECRKIYWDDFDAARFLDPTIESNYPDKSYHRIYFGEILAIRGDASYRSDAR